MMFVSNGDGMLFSINCADVCKLLPFKLLLSYDVGVVDAVVADFFVNSGIIELYMGNNCTELLYLLCTQNSKQTKPIYYKR